MCKPTMWAMCQKKSTKLFCPNTYRKLTMKITMVHFSGNKYSTKGKTPRYKSKKPTKHVVQSAF
jgi:hypothetical protein